MEADHFGFVALTTGTKYQFATESIFNIPDSPTVTGCRCRTSVEILAK